MPTITIVLRLVGGAREGHWWVVTGTNGVVLPATQTSPEILLVPTGSVEWDAYGYAEVWVPEDKIEIWMAKTKS